MIQTLAHSQLRIAMTAAPTASTLTPRLTSLSHGGGCGCKIAPGVLSGILRGTVQMPVPPELLVGTLVDALAAAVTAAGELGAVLLPDGSRLTLDARSAVDLDFRPGHRRVRLRQGALLAEATPQANLGPANYKPGPGNPPTPAACS